MSAHCFVGIGLYGLATCASATDVVNQDQRTYLLKVQGEGKLSISNYKIDPGGSL